MKRAVVVCVLLFFCIRAYGEETETTERAHFSIGYKQYYMWWDPVWAVSEATPMGSLVWQDLKMEKVSTFVYNPVFSIDFIGPFSLSGSFLYGDFRSQGRSLGYFPLPMYILLDKQYNVKKYDAELLVQYKINQWCKIFFGPKYQGYRINDRYGTYIIGSVSVSKFSDNIRFHSGGLGAGVGFTVHIASGLFILPNLSAIALGGKDFTSRHAYSLVLFPGNSRVSWLVGGIGDLSFAYYIDKLRTTITAGMKCQYLYYTRTSRREYRQKYDLFFGPYLGFVVTI